MNAQREEALRFERLALRDAHAFDAIVNHCPAENFPVAAFHAQQAVEKCLKAVLSLRDMDYPRTHSLEELAGLVLSAHIALPAPPDDLMYLTPYAIEFRYDDTLMPLCTPEQAHRLVIRFLEWTAACLAEN